MGPDRLAFYKPALNSVVFREVSPFVLFFVVVFVFAVVVCKFDSENSSVGFREERCGCINYYY